MAMAQIFRSIGGALHQRLDGTLRTLERFLAKAERMGILSGTRRSRKS